MSNKSVDDFVKDLVQSPQELPIWPATWEKVSEKYVEEEKQEQGESEED